MVSVFEQSARSPPNAIAVNPTVRVPALTMRAARVVVERDPDLLKVKAHLASMPLVQTPIQLQRQQTRRWRHICFITTIVVLWLW